MGLDLSKIMWSLVTLDGDQFWKVLKELNFYKFDNQKLLITLQV